MWIFYKIVSNYSIPGGSKNKGKKNKKTKEKETERNSGCQQIPEKKLEHQKNDKNLGCLKNFPSARKKFITPKNIKK